MDPMLEMNAHSTSAAQQATDSTSIDCSSCNLVGASASSPAGVKKGSGLKASADPDQDTDHESHPLQQQQQQHGWRLKRKAKAKSKVFYGLTALLLGTLTTATLVFLVYHHMSHEGRDQKEVATAASTASPGARGFSTSVTPPLPSSATEQMDWIQVAIDMLAVDNCNGSRVDSMQPCKMNSRFITADQEALAPLRCVDDAFLERPDSGQNHCTAEATRRAFQLLASKGRVRVTQPGLYMLIGHVTVRLREAAELHFGVAVNQQLPFVCTVQSPGTGSPPGEDQPVPYSHCSMQGLRRLRAGDEVWLLVPHGNIPLQSLYRSTFLQVARLSP